MADSLPTAPIAGSGRQPPVLAFENCVIALAGSEDETLELSTHLAAGEQLLVHAEDGHHEDAVTRALCGLASPLRGRVRFQGHDWRDLSSERSNAMRGRIGTVFGEDIWSPYRTVMDGIILPQLHHTRRPLEEISQEAAHWARRFGLPGLPRDRPDQVSRRDRQAASFARAFVGESALIVIRHQPRALPPGLQQAAIDALWELRERGTAVIWFTRADTLERDEAIPATRQLRLGGPLSSALEIDA